MNKSKQALDLSVHKTSHGIAMEESTGHPGLETDFLLAAIFLVEFRAIRSDAGFASIEFSNKPSKSKSA